jgi:hypothetical protein
MFDVLRFIHLKGWRTDDLTDGQIVELMEHMGELRKQQKALTRVIFSFSSFSFPSPLLLN